MAVPPVKPVAKPTVGLDDPVRAYVLEGEGEFALGEETLKQDFVEYTCANDLQCDLTVQWNGLLSEPHLAHAALAQLSNQTVGTDGARFGGR